MLGLSEKQVKQIAELESTVAEKLKSILSPDQTKKLQQQVERRRPDGLPGPPEGEDDGPPPPPRRR